MLRIYKIQNSTVFSSNCYILISDGRFAVIDPSSTYDDVTAAIPELADCEPVYVLLTHGHIDHIWGINSYVSRGAAVKVASSDMKMLRDPALNCAVFISGPISSYTGEAEAIREGDVLMLGNESISVLESPGHTEGSVCYSVGDALFTGDTLFSGGGYGRTDLPGGDMQKLILSLRKICNLDPAIRIYPGHGDISRLGESLL